MARKSRSSLSVKLSAAAIAAAVAVHVEDRGMSVSEAGVDLVMRSEDCRVAVYRDAVGYPTAGCGHLVTDGEYRVGHRLTEAEIRDIFVDDLVPTVECVNKGIKGSQATQGQFNAFVSLAYNIGCGRFLRSTALKCHLKGDVQCAINGIGMWVKAGGRVLSGLVNRRKAEQEMYRGKGRG
ncbi:MAG: lysozyme [Gammaproteobacteria bacterium]|nr:lysozyme [Gammaproteobacteria bacterium]